MKIEVTIHRQDVNRIVEIDGYINPDDGDLSKQDDSEIKKFLLEHLEDEWKQGGVNVWLNPGGTIIQESKTDFKVSKSNGSYHIET